VAPSTGNADARDTHTELIAMRFRARWARRIEVDDNLHHQIDADIACAGDLTSVEVYLDLHTVADSQNAIWRWRVIRVREERQNQATGDHRASQDQHPAP